MQIIQPIELSDAYDMFGVFIPNELDFGIGECLELETGTISLNALEMIAQYSVYTEMVPETYQDVPKYDILTGCEDPYDMLDVEGWL